MTIERLDLQSRQKWSVNGTSRITPAQETLKRVTFISQKIGVTRLADITNMDILGIPNYSAVLPGTEDYIWVYSGKGPTKAHAMASALMESIERYSSLPSGGPKNFIQGSYDQLSKSFNVLHPDEIVEPLRFQYNNEMSMDFLSGFDLFSEEPILVPASVALFRYSPVPPFVDPFAFHHTNGLASGNVMEEAICHSLCEVIERDATSLAELRASAIPFHFLRHITNALREKGYALNSIPTDKYVDDPSIFSDVDISQVEFQPVKALGEKFLQAKIPLIIKDITSDIGIPTFNASSIEWISHDYGYLAEGHGTHPDARVALMRAITEVSQTRAANIQGARDDLRKIRYGQNNTDDKRAWQFMPSSKKVKFSEVTSYFNQDILNDIKLILEHLKQTGLNRAIIVNLTNDSIGIPVVRAIVPGLETFKITKSVMGWRARRYFKK
ncbi:MAG TPA: YcaO-like family protein [Nitrososphaeraceae archaeon]|nr:YcaO-like family protein [Nitrososphaeraceae archaeon]